MVAKTLGVTKRTVKLLEKERLLVSKQNPIRRHVRHFPRSDVDKLLSDLDRRVNVGAKRRRDACFVPFRDGLRRTGIPIASFIQCIQRGVVMPVAVDSARTGLQRYMFDLKDLKGRMPVIPARVPHRIVIAFSSGYVHT